MELNQIVINGDNIELLKNYPDNYFDAVVTDPPYGLGKEPNAQELMKDWVEKGYHEISGTGFMGKEWDAFIPQPVFWKEVFRVLKHGGHVLSFFGTRTYDWGVMSMRFAGFEVRDCIQWLYGSGFPKSHNISKALDKMEGAEREVVGKKERGSVEEAKERGAGFLSDPANRNNTKQFGYGTELITAPSTESAKQWDGWGTALKPANEPIVLARKPLEKGLSIAENILKWGVGGINIDASRVGSETRTTPVFSNDTKTDSTSFNLNSNIQHERVETNQGRFPANIILTHHEDCECKGTKKVKAIKGGNSRAIQKNTYNDFGKNYDNTPNGVGCGFGDENGQEEVENWDCHEDCPIRILDEQSGITKSSGGNIGVKNNSVYGKFNDSVKGQSGIGDKGGASRFFYVAKASKAERNKGLEHFEEKPLAFSNQAKAELKRGNLEFNGNGITGEGIVGHGNKVNMLKNFHPTVKPIKLMQYLVKMITPPNGIVLDPFCGSGTTGVACKLDGFQFVGLEQDLEYAKIAEARITNYEPEVSIAKKSKEKNNIEQIPLF
jgi:site-specific DNA-methyltransferase (adenine-specific)